METTKPFFKRFWWIFVIIVGLGAIWAMMTFIVHPKDQGGTKDTQSNSQGSGQSDNWLNTTPGKYPKCPANLSGILTYQLMDPKYIGAMLPLGNVSPPGHTFPVDHIYFSLNSDGKIPLYAPANGWITHIMANSAKKTADSQYVFDSYVISYTVCDGLVLDFAGYTDVIQPIKDEMAKHTDACKSGITKVGHDTAAEQQCDYNNIEIKVTSGEQIGYTERTLNSDGTGYTIPFEIWTADYNKAPRSDIDWTYYDDNRYAHAMCTFDLYSDTLKSQFDAKFGNFSYGTDKDSSGKPLMGQPVFTPRTVQPLCGQITQNIVGSLQGAWFSSKPVDNGTGSIGDSGAGISFIHNNVDPAVGEVVIGGEFDNKLTGVIAFTPTHTGTVNREPSEIKDDGQTYCYSNNTNAINTGQSVTGKILVQLIDNTHIKADHQTGTCTTSEIIKTTYNFER